MEIRKGSVRSFDAATYTATVQMAGSLATWLEGVPVSRGIPGGLSDMPHPLMVSPSNHMSGCVNPFVLSLSKYEWTRRAARQLSCG